MSDSFKDFQINTFASILLPVFINIVNNAIYWLSGVERRIIRFDYIE